MIFFCDGEMVGGVLGLLGRRRMPTSVFFLLWMCVIPYLAVPHVCEILKPNDIFWTRADVFLLLRIRMNWIAGSLSLLISTRSILKLTVCSVSVQLEGL